MTKRSMFGAFKQRSDDLYVKQVGPLRFHCLRVESPEEWGDGAEADYGKYYVDLSEVDVGLFDWAHVCSILASCGWVLKGHDETGLASIFCPYDGTYVTTTPEMTVRCIVESAVGYGARAPLWQDGGNNLRKLVRAAISESHSLCKDSDRYEHKMEGTMVNQIGTCARDYMLGEFGFRRDTPEDKIRTILRSYERA